MVWEIFHHDPVKLVFSKATLPMFINEGKIKKTNDKIDIKNFSTWFFV
jgi:hypothetical protein